MEVISEDEAALEQNFRDCNKNPGHTDFIPVHEFTLAHLPYEYQIPELVKFVHMIVRLTVELYVVGTGSKRPKFIPGTTDPYPFYGCGKREIRFGSGFIESIRRNKEKEKALQKDCACDECKLSGTPTKEWTEVKVVTAAHVVYDLEEAKKSKGFLFYDADSTDRNQCIRLTKVKEVDANPDQDCCKITYIIHDCNDDKKLIEIDGQKLIEIDGKKLTEIDGKKWIEIDGELSEIDGKKVIEIDRIKLIEKLQKDAQTYMESVIQNRDKFKRKKEIGSKETGDVKKLAKDMPSLIKNSANDVKETDRLNERKDSSDELVGASKEFPRTDQMDGDTTSDLQVKPAYDPSQSLTIVVSHPHGCSKKITVGKITNVEVEKKPFPVLSYHYDNATCRGSSGAPVFVLGKTIPNFVVHGSALACKPSSQDRQDRQEYQGLELD